MPTYQYACTSCSHQLEAVQSFTDDPLTECPECSGRLRKVFNSVGIVFKGSGFYRTDSRAAADSSNGKSGKGSSSSSGSSDSGGGSSGSGSSAKNGSGTGSGDTSGSSGTGSGAAGGESTSAKKPATTTGLSTS